MIKTQVNTLYVSGLGIAEVESYFEKFGEEGWLDIENKILIPVKEQNKFEITKLDMFFGIISENYTFIVIDLVDCEKK